MLNIIYINTSSNSLKFTYIIIFLGFMAWNDWEAWLDSNLLSNLLASQCWSEEYRNWRLQEKWEWAEV